jgi:hypothetical protein
LLSEEVKPPLPPPRGRMAQQVPKDHASAAPASLSSSPSLGVLSQSSHSEGEDDYLGILSGLSSAAASSTAGSSTTRMLDQPLVYAEESWEREREQVWEQEKERRLRDKSWQASMGSRSPVGSTRQVRAEAELNPQRRSPRKPQLPVLRGVVKSVRVEAKEPEATADMDGRMTVESKVQHTWARWLCRSFAASPTPHWSSGRGAPKLPVPEHVKSSVLMALILGQLLPPSALPPSLVTLMMEHKGKGPEKWTSGKAQSAGEKATSSVRRIIGDALRVLQERMPDGGKTLPGILPRCLLPIPIKTLCSTLCFQRLPSGDCV